MYSSAVFSSSICFLIKDEITGELIFALGLTLRVGPRTHFAIAKCVLISSLRKIKDCLL